MTRLLGEIDPDNLSILHSDLDVPGDSFSFQVSLVSVTSPSTLVHNPH